MSVLDVYAQRLASLTQQEVVLVRERLGARGLPHRSYPPLPADLVPARLATELRRRDLIAADVVAVLLGVPGPVAENAIQKVCGRAITVLPPQASPPPPPRHEGARPSPPDYGEGGRRRILSVAPNPKRENTGAHERYDLYRVGATIADYLAAGGQLRDVSWDTRQGFVVLSEPDA